MKEIHGVADAMKLGSGGVVDTTALTVEDADRMVVIRIACNCWPVGLTSEGARAFAREITKAADRVDRAADAKTEVSHVR